MQVNCWHQRIQKEKKTWLKLQNTNQNHLYNKAKWQAKTPLHRSDH
jgi:hypothetical protein